MGSLGCVENRPTLNLILDFTPEQTIRRVRTVPQSSVIVNIYGLTKEPRQSELAHPNVDNFMYVLLRDLDMVVSTGGYSWAPNEEKLGRIVNGQTQSLKEEELLHIINMRSALTYLGWLVLPCLTVPDEIKYQFAVGSGHLSPEGLNRAIRDIYDWGREHPKENRPIKLTPKIESQLTRLYERMQALIGFWNEKNPVTDVYRMPYAIHHYDDAYQSDCYRLGIVERYIEDFAPRRYYRPFLRKIGR